MLPVLSETEGSKAKHLYFVIPCSAVPKRRYWIFDPILRHSRAGLLPLRRQGRKSISLIVIARTERTRQSDFVTLPAAP